MRVFLHCSPCPLQQEDFDVIQFVEAYMDVLTALGDAENVLYSANFADYAGGGGTTVRGSRREVQSRIFALLTREIC